jgi:hypothetical protein
LRHNTGRTVPGRARGKTHPTKKTSGLPEKLARVSNHTPRNRQARFKEFESSPQDRLSSQSPRKLPTPITEARSSKSSLLGATRDRPMLRSRRRLNIEDVSQNKTLGRFSLHLRRCRTPGVYIFVYEMSAFASVRSRTAKRYSSEHSVELSLSLAHTFSHDLVLSHRSARTSKKRLAVALRCA